MFEVYNKVLKEHLDKGCKLCENPPPFPIWWECPTFTLELKEQSHKVEGGSTGESKDGK